MQLTAGDTGADMPIAEDLRPEAQEGGMADEVGGGAGADQLNAIRPEDDEEPDRQEVVDTPDGKPTAEWLVFRKHTPYMEPLEKTDEWGPSFEPSFDEVPLFKGRINDYKRREAYQVGIVKCKIKIFRKEDETISGKAKADTSRDPRYYEVGSDDPSISDALEYARPYRQYNIYETYPDATVEVRAYCLKAFQVTPGRPLSEEDGQPVYYHYLRAHLGPDSKMSHVVKSLNPNFFWVAQFKQCQFPGPSQLKLELCDGKFVGLTETNTRMVGQTVIDLEDRWFCQEWRDVKYKPREVWVRVGEQEKPSET